VGKRVVPYSTGNALMGLIVLINDPPMDSKQMGAGKYQSTYKRPDPHMAHSDVATDTDSRKNSTLLPRFGKESGSPPCTIQLLDRETAETR
jgi:hypothetical protein